MNSKMSTFFLVLVASAVVLQTAEAIIFTLGGLALDSALAFLIFGKFLHIPLILGKRSVDAPTVAPLGGSASASEYLAVAAAMDKDRCLPLAVCVAMANAKLNDTTQQSKFDELIVESFISKVQQPNAAQNAPLSFYIEAAKYGQSAKTAENCRLVAPTCKFTMAELNQLSQAVSQYQL